MATTSPAARRPRHDPKATEKEILDAAEALLRERPFREVTVDEVMRNTGLKRPAFYVHFRDRHDLALRVVQRIAAELFEMVDRWLKGDRPADDVRPALEGVVELFVRHGAVLRALADAAGSDETVDLAYHELVGGFVAATEVRIREQQADGLVAKDLDAAETARALIWLNERYLSEAFGRSPQADPDRAVAVLERIWTSALYR